MLYVYLLLPLFPFCFPYIHVADIIGIWELQLGGSRVENMFSLDLVRNM